MNQKISSHYRNLSRAWRSRAWKVVIASVLFGLLQTAQAGREARTVLSQNEGETWEGTTQEKMEIKTLPSQTHAAILAGRKAYHNQDYEVAFKKFMPLAEQGNMDAQYYIGLMYANGYGVPQNPAKAEKWFRRFSERLGTGAEYNLGVMYFEGKLVPQDYRQAIAWFKRAAEEGDVMAQFSLGYIYDNGYGVPQDRREAIWWYRKAANQGHLNSQRALGVIYRKGQGVKKDYVQAYFWFNVAAEQGDKSAASLRDALAKEMTTSQIAEAIQLTHEWQLSSRHSGQGH